MIKFKIVLLLIFLSSVTFAQDADPSMIEMKVQNDLDRVVGKILKPEQFGIQVTVQSETKKERVLVEGESLSQSVGQKAKVTVPPLPGFTLVNSEANEETPQPSSQTRQIFKEVEKNILKSVQVFAQIDNEVSDDDFKQIQSLIGNYVQRSYGSKARVSVTRAKLTRDRTWTDFWQDNKSLILGLFVGLLAVGLTWFLYNKLMNRKHLRSLSPYYEPRADLNDNARDVTHKELPEKTGTPLLGAPNPSKHEVDIKNDKYLPLPENARFADLRSKLIETFLGRSDVFRHYWKKLSLDSKLEIFSALRGPALDNLLEVLELEAPGSGETNVLPSEEQLEFYEKNFQEFVQTFSWQNSQFFGFLHLLTYQQVLTLLKSENAVVATFIIKYCKPDISAQLLNDLSVEKRAEIMQNFTRISELSSDDMQAIETKVRKSAELLPHFIWSKQMPEIEFWERILSKSDNTDGILMEIEKTNPLLYKKLSRFRFKLDDLPGLPQPLVSEVLEKLDNEELARAFVDLGSNIQAYAFDTLPENRRKLVESQILSFAGLSRSEKEEAIRNVTIKFREAII